MTSNPQTDEEGRLGALYRHGIPGADLGEAVERIVKIAMASTGVPIAGISVIDRDQQTFLAVRGMPDTPISRADAICDHTVAGAKPMIVEDLPADPRFAANPLVTGEVQAKAYLGVPLVTADGYVLGTLFVIDTRPRDFTEEQMTIAVNLANLAMAQVATRQPESFDFLTGALTRRRFQLDVEREYERAVRYERPAALIFVDIDGFAEINKAVGPDIADEVLKAVANRCMEAIRSPDSFGRVAGEEFGLLLPETMAYEASQCAERIREIISKLRFRTEAGVLSITASLGVAPMSPAIRSAMDWFAQADIALYAAKRAGRNCVSFAPINDEDETTLTADDLPPHDIGLPKLH
ncbi:sensor domain-containing diguanylate cyclase [Pelagibacterium xiamenense]|uniref:sensor domain-containing diguanylate cyclase n=1 Tax=Pelagibacterium xiamenense TaxID=2901140 RepID=UPI001E3A1599|nr:sensor domain-containing diguanylate cyclase [Pelagibacterium xiamenense]MCD7059463.1 sensor domain-containing diguanylate cyclase [Pelagibacterium xiamenense]